MIAADDTAIGAIGLARKIAGRSQRRRFGADGAVGSVTACVDGLRNSCWPGVAWRFSLLSTDGCPLQFAFSTYDDALRYTAEVAGPELAEVKRLRAGCDLAARLGGGVPAWRRRAWTSMQSGHHLRWGAWIGVRHDGLSSRVKLYVEVPRESREVGESSSVAIVPSSRPAMIGYDCESGVEELYFRQPQMDARELSAFLRFIAAAPRRRAVLAAFAELCGLPVRAALRWVNFGYSIVSVPGAGPEFVMFVRSRSVGNLARIRSHFRSCEDRFGRTHSAYRDFLGDLPDARLPDHEIVSVIGRDADDIELRAGVSAAALAAL